MSPRVRRRPRVTDRLRDGAGLAQRLGGCEPERIARIRHQGTQVAIAEGDADEAEGHIVRGRQAAPRAAGLVEEALRLARLTAASRDQRRVGQRVGGEGALTGTLGEVGGFAIGDERIRGLRFRGAQVSDLVLDEGEIGRRGDDRARLIQVRLCALRGSHGERPGRQRGQYAHEASAVAGTAGDRPRSLQTLRGLLVTAERLERLAEPGQRGDLFAGPARAVVEAGRLGPIHGSVLERAALVGGDPALDETVRGIGVRAEGRSRRDETHREGQHSEARC